MLKHDCSWTNFIQPNDVRFSSDINKTSVVSQKMKKKKQDVKHITKKFNSLKNIFINTSLQKLFPHTKARKKSVNV